MRRGLNKTSLLKTFTWRIIASLITVGLVYAFNKDITTSLFIGIAEFTLKLVLYYGHEHVWSGSPDTRKKSLLKSFSWRFIASGLTTTLVLISGESIGVSLTIGLFELLIKIAVYYLHERLWLRVNWDQAVEQSTASAATPVADDE
ncbi:MAG: DUF2061 domain-containing protein [Candidatus Woesearchaeota archaeon]